LGTPAKDTADLRREQVLHRRPAALVRHVVQLDAGERVEERADQMLGAAVTGARVVDLARLRLGCCDELPYRAHGELLRVDHQRIRSRSDHADVGEVLDRVVWQLLVDMRGDEMRAAGNDERVAIGRGFGCEIRADGSAGAGPVVDEDLLAELLGKPRRQHSRRRVGEAAGRERHYQPDGTRRPGLREPLIRDRPKNQK
jgi:hypothetical protein